ncbi:hypothetical protein OG21DRAFT_1526394 [Imleria badia]|nr:hypothetical protein OG21DRAFT_1526394 [Imleria badia]
MPLKRKFTVYKVTGDSQVEEVVSAAPNLKRLRAEQLFDDDKIMSETQPAQRHSLRVGKGHSGVSQVVNLMAPSYAPAKDEDEESQIPPWATSSTPLTQVQPAFTPLQSDACFGFKIPSWTTTSTRTISNLHEYLNIVFSRMAAQLPDTHDIQNQGPTDNTPSLALLQHIGFCQTESFLQLPSTLPRLHSMLVMEVKGLPTPQNEVLNAMDLMINVVNPLQTPIPTIYSKMSPSTTMDLKVLLSRQQIVDVAKHYQCNRPSRPTDSEIEDVIAQNCQCNRPPHLPNNTQLLTTRSQQTSQSLHSVTHTTSADELLAPISAHPPTAPASTGPPKTQSLPASASTTVTPAAAGPIPQPNLNPVASTIEYMDEVVAKCHARGLTIPEGWWPQYTNGITKLLWEDIGNWQSSLKKKAHSFIHQGYG